MHGSDMAAVNTLARDCVRAVIEVISSLCHQIVVQNAIVHGCLEPHVLAVSPLSYPPAARHGILGDALEHILECWAPLCPPLLPERGRGGPR